MFDLKKIILTAVVFLIATPTLSGNTTSTGAIATAAVPLGGGQSAVAINPVVAINSIVNNAQASLSSGSSASVVVNNVQAQASALIYNASSGQIQQVVGGMTNLVQSSGSVDIPLSQAQAISAIAVLRALGNAGELNPTLQNFLDNLSGSLGL